MRTERMTLARMASLVDGLHPQPDPDASVFEITAIEPLPAMPILPLLPVQPKAWQNKYENIGKR